MELLLLFEKPKKEKKRMTPEWITLLAPFVSGAVGAGATAGVAWGMLKQKYTDLERRMAIVEQQIQHQVGDSKCDKMRGDCQVRMEKICDEIKHEIIANRNWVTDRFTEIARFMGAHNGH